MSELNFVFGLGFVVSVIFAFFLGEHPEVRTASRDLTSQQSLSIVPDGARSAPDHRAGQVQMVTNDAAIEILKSYEGLATEAYPEAGAWLIGYGHKGEEINEGMTISPRTAERYLRKDLKAREDFVRSVVEVSLNENEFSALVILSYNIGYGAFRNSTVLRELNEGDRQAAAEAFLIWNKVKRGGKLMESPRLTRRRGAERDLFLAAR